MYDEFARIYDTLMQDVPYKKWLLRINEWIKAFGISKPNGSDEKNLILDLGCGTGTFTEMMARLGYDMIGIDSSLEMLNVAMAKKDESGSKILYLCQDMRKMELYSTVGTIICICDSLNYLLSEKDILATFGQVKNYLYPGGIFIFDFNTKYKYEAVIGHATIAENHEDCAFVWENYYHPDACLNEYDLTFFIKGKDGRFDRYQETHVQKGYELGEIRCLLKKAGLDIITIIDDDSEKAPTDESERIVIVAKSAYKEFPRVL